MAASQTNWLAGEHGRRPPLDRWLTQAVDLGLGGVIFVAPLLMGGRHDVGRLVFVALVCATAVAWLLRQALGDARGWRWSGAEWLVLGGAALLCLQLAPLPAALASRLGGETAHILPLWSGAADAATQLGSWSQLTLTPVETRGSLVIFLAYGLLFLVVVQRLRELDDVERMLRWVALAAAGMALLGLAQLLAGNGKFLWVYDHPFRDATRAVKGAFSNSNHCAFFLASGIAPLIWWMWHSRDAAARGSSRRREGAFATAPARDPSLATTLLGAALGVVAFALLLTLSRSGIIVGVVAAAVCIAVYVQAGMLGRRSLLALLAIVALAGTAVYVYGSKSLMNEVASLRAGTLDELDHNATRRKLWAADLEAAAAFPLLGTGAGSHAEVYPVYYDEPTAVEHTHAESGYIQVLLETGLAGLALLLCGIGAAAVWCLGALRASAPRIKAAAAVVAAGLAISLLQSIWDFVWYLPACMSLTLVLAACGCRLFQLAGREHAAAAAAADPPAVPRWGWALACLSVCGLSALMIHDRLAPACAAPHWDRYLRQVVLLRAPAEEGLRQAPPLEVMIGHLERVVERHARHARAHARLANLYMRYFDQRQQQATNAVMLVQLRSAVLASKFPSRAAQDEWLAAAVGDNRRLLEQALRHVHCALDLCPLQGESYIDLAELGFLEGRGAEVVKKFIDQAARLRPHSGAVQFVAGREAILAGDVERAISFWRSAFAQDAQYRLQILQLLAAEMPAEFFLAEFTPDVDGTRQVYLYYRGLGRHDEARQVALRYAALLARQAAEQTGKPAGRSWYRAYEVHTYLDQPDVALDCLRCAVENAPQDFTRHRELAVQLLAHGQLAGAVEQLQWCLHRAPHDGRLRQLLAETRRRQLEETTPQRTTSQHDPAATRR